MNCSQGSFVSTEYVPMSREFGTCDDTFVFELIYSILSLVALVTALFILLHVVLHSAYACQSSRSKESRRRRLTKILFFSFPMFVYAAALLFFSLGRAMSVETVSLSSSRMHFFSMCLICATIFPSLNAFLARVLDRVKSNKTFFDERRRVDFQRKLLWFKIGNIIELAILTIVLVVPFLASQASLRLWFTHLLMAIVCVCIILKTWWVYTPLIIDMREFLSLSQGESLACSQKTLESEQVNLHVRSTYKGLVVTRNYVVLVSTFGSAVDTLSLLIEDVFQSMKYIVPLRIFFIMVGTILFLKIDLQRASAKRRRRKAVSSNTSRQESASIKPSSSINAPVSQVLNA